MSWKLPLEIAVPTMAPDPGHLPHEARREESGMGLMVVLHPEGLQGSEVATMARVTRSTAVRLDIGFELSPHA